MKNKKVLVINAGLIVLLLGACSALKPIPIPVQSNPTQTALPATGKEYRFVTDKLLIPTTQEQAQAFAVNVDGDPQGNPENLFGKLMTLLVSAAPNLELQTNLDQAVNDGQLVSLHVVKTDNILNDVNVSWSIFLGQKTESPPSFDGSDQFSVDSTASTNLPIVGSLTNGHFTGGPGAAQVRMFLLGQSVEVNLIGVHLEADFNTSGCANGKLGGGVTVEEFKGKLLPALADGLNKIIKEKNASSQTLLNAFDSDRNGTITLEELEGNPVLMMAISPDLDLLDASGKFNPGQDGVKDSYSVGLGFTCVPATFAAPGD